MALVFPDHGEFMLGLGKQLALMSSGTFGLRFENTTIMHVLTPRLGMHLRFQIVKMTLETPHWD